MEFARIDTDLNVEDFHRAPFEFSERTLWVPRLTGGRTLVLGSSQPAETIDTKICATNNIDIVRRRTGGGAVVVSADDLTWFDVIIGQSDPLWSNDVGRAFEWLGLVCQRALAALGHATTMHTGAQIVTAHSPAICFAGLGSGELVANGAKVLGISQRRTRTHARFQVAILRQWSGSDHAALLNLPQDEREKAALALHPVAAGIDVDPQTLLWEIQQQLPT